MEIYENLTKNIENYTYVLFYYENCQDFNKLYMYTDTNTTCIDLKTSKELAEFLKSYYKIEKFPALLYRNGLIYADQNIQEQMNEIDDLNIKKTTKFLNDFVHNEGITVFIKGTIEKPYCKYTKQLIKNLELLPLDIKNVKYFDIFTDQNLRYYMKIVNSWETFPMIYIDGKFIGGLDNFISYIKTKKL